MFVVDDDPGFVSFVSALLEQGGYAVRSFTSGEAALEATRTEPPALVVLDVHLPGGASGYEVCRQLRDELGERVGIIFVSGERREPFDRVGGLLLGADDYVVKPFEPGELLARVRGLLRRVGVEERVPSHNGTEKPFTKREQEVLSMLASGLRQNEIAERLVISPKTVATHIQRILAKLGVHSRAEAVAIAHQRHLVGSSSPDERSGRLPSAV